MIPKSHQQFRHWRVIVGSGALALVAACGPAPIPSGIDDPHEASNRRRHDFNRAVDRAVFRPTSTAYGTLVPQPVRTGVTNFSNNLSLPGEMMNGVLQGRPEDVMHNLFRFLVNTTFGIGGLLDPATDMGLAARNTDFGETLHVWGVGEGAFLEVPFYGPSTTRDFAGFVVDVATNPVGLFADWPNNEVIVGTKVLSRFDQRYQYSDFVDSVLYESADSYAQSRQMFLQSRRHALGGEEAETEIYDPYDDIDGN